MRRFFIDPANIVGANAVLTGSEARHVTTVLRLSAGSKITLFDGSGSLYEALITKISATRVETKIIALTPYIDIPGDISPALHLGIALLKGRKMDFIIQKATELGIASVRPFRSRYCAAFDPGADRPSRWQKIALEACKQCNRPKPPDLHEISDFNVIISAAGENGHDLKLIFWEEEKQKPIRDIISTGGSIKSALILIGPEGGFSTAEVADAVAAGFQPVTLGSRILRAETAAVAAASIVQYELGNLA
ncbi:MAG: 16S rRNA (uracil(1498)-N(3))-methyltransferase [Desulfobulbales bacterium]|nr:16S rRNA (uracil(1498)-N(3))-methyltransferase [Desulfobulbales bacterium]